METFHRNLLGYPLLDKTPIDTAISSFYADGLQAEPKIVTWGTYARMKSILHRVLGRAVFDVLFREEGGNVNSRSFALASTIVMFYVQRPDATFDLQTTLIANVTAMRCNLSVNHKARAFAFCDRLIESCGFERDYAKHVKHVLIDDGVLAQPWWSTVRY